MAYNVSDYIIDRLSALGAEHLFTVPGNYCAEFLITAQRSGKIKCIGTTNEMEAGYAADAYSRLRGIGVVCVTYGVGTGSLLNAIEGAFVEYCPVVLINGSAKEERAQQLVQQGVLFAHAIDTIRTDEAIFRPVTAATTVIVAPEMAPTEIDRVLRVCISEKRPVYLEVRDGVWLQECEKSADSNIPLKPFADADEDINKAADAAVEDVLKRLGSAKHPVLWGGEGLQRLGLQQQFGELVRLTSFPYTTTLLGKSLISEKEYKETFIGVYDSVFAPRSVKDVVEGADCILALGTILTDFYSKIVEKSFDKMILAAGRTVRVGSYSYPNVPLDRFINRLVNAIKEKPDFAAAHTPPAGFDQIREYRSSLWEISETGGSPANVATLGTPASTPLTWDSFFTRIHSFIEKDMVILADTSLCLFPAAELQIEKPSHFIAQTAWLSIGFMTGAAVGVSMAIPYNERAVVLIGDGGFQTIAQAFSTLVRQEKPAILFVFNNHLYGIEQYLVDQAYYKKPGNSPTFFNELAEWDYAKLGEAFGGKGLSVSTLEELEQALIAAKALKNMPALIAVKLDSHDLPAEIRATLQLLAAGAEGSFAPDQGRGNIAPAGFN